MKGRLQGGNVQQTTLAAILDPTMKVVVDYDLESHVLHELDLSQFSEDGAMLEKLRDLI